MLKITNFTLDEELLKIELKIWLFSSQNVHGQIKMYTDGLCIVIGQSRNDIDIERYLNSE